MLFQASLLLPVLATLPSLSLAAALTSGQHESSMALAAIMGRQVHICAPVPAPATCEKSCGAGYTQCVSFPNCYNPTIGQSCCSNGKYCPAGYYCTDAGCCPNGTPLSECGATQTLSVIPPSSPETTTAPAAPTTTSTIVVVETTSTTTIEETTSTTTVEETTTDVVETETSTSTAAGTTATTTATTTKTVGLTVSSTATASRTIVVQTANAAARQGQAVLGLALGGMGLAALL